MQPLKIESFLQQFAAGTHTEAEHQQFIDWLKTASEQEAKHALDRYYFIISKNTLPATEADPAIVAQIEAALNQYELGKPAEFSKVKTISWRRFTRIAAAVLILIGSATAIWLSLGENAPVVTAKAPLTNKGIKNELLPGGNKATLTLSNGSVISLDDTQNGKIAQQGSAVVKKSASGQLVYETLTAKPAEIVFNTLSTPRGGQFKLVLPDASKVWLNAASSIKYPTSFAGNERKVEITGEAYFEIAHNAAMPFIVSVNGMEVKVLGTHFNVNAYSDEAAIKTSLLEGSVQLSKAGASVTLLPGQQAQSATGANMKVVSDVDMEQVVAWKNGYFSFNRADLQTVMRQIARWYDVEISYEGKVPERSFGGKIDRNSNASQVLKILEESKVHFSIENKKIIVRP